MRNGAPLLLVVSLAVLVPSGLSAENLMLVGKQVSWESWGEEPKGISPSASEGETLETPNQKRRRLNLAADAPLPDTYAEDATQQASAGLVADRTEIDDEPQDRLAKAR